MPWKAGKHETWGIFKRHFWGVYTRHSQMPKVDSATYYEVWLDALESLLIQRGLASAADLAELKDAWTEAYLHTPHGMPVELGGDGDHTHAHSPDHAED
jgi:hypothetical protein